MHTVKIIRYRGGNEYLIAEQQFDDVAEVVKWMLTILDGWCIDEDVEVQLDGIIVSAQ